MAILFDHILRLLTLRHDGSGLGVKRFRWVLIFLVLTVAVSAMRWGDVFGGWMHGGALVGLGIFFSYAHQYRQAVAFALISISIDAFAILSANVFIQTPLITLAFIIWETASVLTVHLRIMKKRRAMRQRN